MFYQFLQKRPFLSSFWFWKADILVLIMPQPRNVDQASCIFCAINFK
uniref:Uncharacterized protein n=1 Tax=Rhizophora mucronata TaxID=61149 RepID=A0A2P2JA36_RHIMU